MPSEAGKLEQVWSWLAEVPDPEIPVISVVDLGIVRAVAFEGDACVVTITPTYSGCPAMQGYLFSPPVSAERFEQLQAMERAGRTWLNRAD